MENEQITEEVRSIRNNNPGNLRAVDKETQKRLTQRGYVLDRAIGFDKDGFAIFPDKETGMSAMRRQLNIDASRGMTGAQMINKYAPKNDQTALGKKYPNKPNSYITNVFSKSGIDPNKPVDPKNLDVIQRNMIAQEGGKKATSHYYGTETKPTSTQSTEGPLLAVSNGAETSAAPGSANNIMNQPWYKHMSKVYDKAFSLANTKNPFASFAADQTVSESKVRFKDLRYKIQEQIMKDDSTEMNESVFKNMSSDLQSKGPDKL